MLAAVTAGMVGSSAMYRRPVAAGVAAATVATLITWRIAIGVINHLSGNISALALSGGYRPAGDYRPSRGDELVLSQAVLDRLDFAPHQEKAELLQ